MYLLGGFLPEALLLLSLRGSAFLDADELRPTGLPASPPADMPL